MISKIPAGPKSQKDREIIVEFCYKLGSSAVADGPHANMAKKWLERAAVESDELMASGQENGGNMRPFVLYALGKVAAIFVGFVHELMDWSAAMTYLKLGTEKSRVQLLRIFEVLKKVSTRQSCSFLIHSP